jgi:hypothetical protein
MIQKFHRNRCKRFGRSMVVTAFYRPKNEAAGIYRHRSLFASDSLISRNTGMRQPLQDLSLFPQHRHSKESLSRNVNFSTVLS